MRGIDHIAVAVRDLAEASRFYRDVLGLAAAGEEEVPAQGVRVAFFEVGTARLELVQPMTPQSPVSGFLESRGPGLHHICLSVDDLDAELERLKERGAAFTSPGPRPGSHGGRVAFIHPRSSGGVLIEIKERPRPPGGGADAGPDPGGGSGPGR